MAVQSNDKTIFVPRQLNYLLYKLVVCRAQRAASQAQDVPHLGFSLTAFHGAHSESITETCSTVPMSIQMKPLRQYFCMVPFVFQYFTINKLTSVFSRFLIG